VVRGSNRIAEFREVHFHFPTDVFPVRTSIPELLRFRAFPAIGLRNPNRQDSGVHEGEDQITGRYFAHRFIKGISCAIGIALGRPEISASDFVAVCLVLVDPPIAHIFRRSQHAILKEFRAARTRPKISRDPRIIRHLTG
jgi:hypothetical protein